MVKKLPEKFEGLVRYLADPQESANEDLAIESFRKMFGESFSRRADAKDAGGHVEGAFVLALGGKTSWYPALLQALAHNRDLGCSSIVVAAKELLAIWRVVDIDEEIRKAAVESPGAPHATRKLLAKRYSRQQGALLERSCWRLRTELLTGRLADHPDLLAAELERFEETLRSGRQVKARVTTKNFPAVLKQMKELFDDAVPTASLRAFYSLLLGWHENSKIELSEEQPDQATLGGEVICQLRPGRRMAFKGFVEDRYIDLGAGESHDDFFAQYDRALDAVDPGFRKRNGIYFTDLDLSRFVMWFVRERLGDIGQDHLVIDPACGSGNLVTSWRSPLELRHKVVSEIEPELLFAIERRMQGDQWHEGRFTVVPRTAGDGGLNFLDRSGAEYLAEIRRRLEEKGHSANRPIAILCNPPYRSDDDQTVSSIRYEIHPSILEEIGLDASSERYCCFLSQMKQVAQAAKENGIPGEPLLLVFTKAAWLTDRPVFSRVRAAMLSVFEDVGGLLVNGKEFFDVQTKFPVAFTIWRYKGEGAGLNPERAVRLLDLTWLTKQALLEVPWHDAAAAAQRCHELVTDPRSSNVAFALGRKNIREWTECKRFDFQREKTKEEQRAPSFRCGLPAGDRRHARKKTLGFADGAYVGFMDDLTPCRIRHPTEPVPYFHLDTRFMRVRRYRCFSGPADNRSFHATTPEQVARLFIWFALGRAFAQEGYPIWADAFELWPPSADSKAYSALVRFACAMGYADNECVSLTFPAHDPVEGAPEILVRNPMSPLDSGSYWSRLGAPMFRGGATDPPARLVAKVDEVFREWRRVMAGKLEVRLATRPSYAVGAPALGRHAGLLQIRDYAKENADAGLRDALATMTDELRAAKKALVVSLGSVGELSYFAQEPTATALRRRPQAELERRMRQAAASAKT